MHAPAGMRLLCALACLAGAGAKPFSADKACDDGCSGGDRPIGARFASRSPAVSTEGMAATAHPGASRAALAILEAGGSAVDAAIAANALLSVVEPMMCGLGGDLMVILWDAEGQQLHGYNGAGRSPLGTSEEDLRAELKARGAEHIPDTGPLSVTVPGAVKGWCDVHGRFGRLSMAEILKPAISAARSGFAVTPVIASYWHLFEGDADVSSNGRHPDAIRGFLEAFTLPSDACGDTEACARRRAPRAGERMRNEAMAKTLERLAEEDGCDDFYAADGSFAQALEASAASNGLLLRGSDLAAHAGEWVAPVGATYRGRYEVFQLPPNPQGLAALEMLNILETFNLTALGHNSAEYIHAHVEAKKLAFADASAYFADPDFARVPVEGIAAKAYAAKQAERIDMRRAKQSVAPGDPFAFERSADTTYLTTADGAGNMVSFIQSVYMHFGSGLVVGGVPLQNRGALFNVVDGAASNAYAPGKRPYQTIMPGFALRDGRPWLSFGVMGGFMQPQGQVQVLCNLIDFGMGLQEAGDAPRYYHVNSTDPTGAIQMQDGGTLLLESGIGSTAVRKLKRKGHRVASAPNPGGYQAILRDDETNAGAITYWGASEFRKDGVALGL